MAHWAQLDADNKVIQVTVGNNDDADEGHDWLVNNLGGTWVKTSYNTIGGVHLSGGTPFRKNYAGVGFTYDEERDAFIPPQPFASWILNEETCLWESPVPSPSSDYVCAWNEELQMWEPAA